MSHDHPLPRLIVALTLLAIGAVACGTGATQSTATQAQAKPAGRSSHQDWPTGHYKVVEGWPKPLPDTRHSHDGWTWGSFGGVYAENPDRIWVAMRGELPLPKGAAPWTPYAALNPSRGNSTGNSDGLNATCQPENKRGWERRFEYSIIVFDRQGNLVDEWPHLDELFSKLPCDRGLNTVDRPTDIAWLPDGTYFITDGYGGTRVVRYDANDNFIMDWGQPPKDPKNPGTVDSIAISADRRLFVIDRGHARVQVLDENGKFLDMSPLRSPLFAFLHTAKLSARESL